MKTNIRKEITKSPVYSRNERTHKMPTTAAVTIAYMIEPLPPHSQEQIVDHLRSYIEEIREDLQWNESFAKSQDSLAAMAKQVKLDVKHGIASPMEISLL